MRAQSMVTITLHTSRLLFELFLLRLTLGWKMHKARKAFEKQLIREGMAKKNAKRLSAFYPKLKNNITDMLNSSIVRRR